MNDIVRADAVIGLSQHADLGPLTAIANLCTSGSCPTVYEAEAGTSLVVQGYPVSAEHAGIDLPPGELLVKIPVGLLLEAARNLNPIEDIDN
ncbi:MAG: hypothetical protein SYR96_32330 [Actinomycetota bacterium]|nr:hypothetical protein [Actinomycetota bacterium]